jgi:hypothetical protein
MVIYFQHNKKKNLFEKIDKFIKEIGSVQNYTRIDFISDEKYCAALVCEFAV